ncbi:PTS sugar transporter subunit IIA [Bacillus taeanensis]|uniref:Mannitol-specific phosphotransferase enzyme IIA component n=1 Tax=Bacillus taeanensis TaxID=273032 RepID=A0A366XWI4_9BACI|nr:PTS sugar transporter subunit IIA [Bacillus taeanensis]RBW68503.1 PTS mannitol transporter subunit IICBA [Bacillus taeanensis]
MKYIDRAGRFISRMVFKNMVVLILLGAIRVGFGSIGWSPNEDIYQIAVLMVHYFIPVLFAYTAGQMIGKHRGGVAAAIVMFVIVTQNSTEMPLILPSLVIGPIVGYSIKKISEWLEGKIPTGFELLLNNIIDSLVACLFIFIGIYWINAVFIETMHLVLRMLEFLTESGYIPLIALIIEPGKALFFNSVINHGILEPLGIQQAYEHGKSVLFLLETNPGPGFGLLLGCYFYLNSKEKGNVKAALPVHVLGGIHEVYFPYALMKPLLIIPLILGGITGNLIFYLFDAGLAATPSPGSIILLLAMAAKGSHAAVAAGFLASTIVSFCGTALVLSYDKKRRGKNQSEVQNDDTLTPTSASAKEKKMEVKNIIFACDAGMGSSAMGAAALQKRLKQEGLNIMIDNLSVDDIPDDADIVISNIRLTERAQACAPQAEHISITSFLDRSFYEELISRLKAQQDGDSNKARPQIDIFRNLNKENILLNMKAKDKWEAIEQVGNVLAKRGNVSIDYIDEMKQREQAFSTYLGNGVAIPHGIDSKSNRIKKAGIVIAQYPDGIAFSDTQKAYIVIAIAGKGDNQLSTLSRLAEIVEQKDKVNQLIHAENEEEVVEVFKNS